MGEYPRNNRREVSDFLVDIILPAPKAGQNISNRSHFNFDSIFAFCSKN